MDHPGSLHKLQEAEEAVTVLYVGHSTNLDRHLILCQFYR